MACTRLKKDIRESPGAVSLNIYGVVYGALVWNKRLWIYNKSAIVNNDVYAYKVIIPQVYSINSFSIIIVGLIVA